jgi:hypothetical protein
MKIFQADIDVGVAEFLRGLMKSFRSYIELNRELQDKSGIVDFFDSQEDFSMLKSELQNLQLAVAAPNPIEYGDFQTPAKLTDEICSYLLEKDIHPNILIEPTCGKGNFIISALRHLQPIDKIYGIEIYKAYIWECKFRIIKYYLRNHQEKKSKIYLFHQNIFNFNFQDLVRNVGNEEILVLGNPPWVTNSILGSLNSENLPKKSNFKSYSGLDAITGKGNFDISEYIALLMLENFSIHNGHMAFLVKNSVIKNIIYELKKKCCRIGDLEKLTINAEEEFNVSVAASLFYCMFNKGSALQCTERDFYTYKNNPTHKTFGWADDKFVSDVEKYKKYKIFDGESPLVWRSGLKHDCSKVMELKKVNGTYVNKMGDSLELEGDLIYGFLKSSDLQKPIITGASKYILVTQQGIGQDTAYIKEKYPLTYNYLERNEAYFLERKSSIYKNKPRFSIFGIGDYSFKKYKVAISGLYKKSRFSLIIPNESKPILLDDTCYFLGFDDFNDAIYTFLLLNHQKTRDFLKSLVFLDMKRVYTKDVLMRIDLKKVAESIPFEEIMDDVTILPSKLRDSLMEKKWVEYAKKLSEFEGGPVQLSLF